MVFSSCTGNVSQYRFLAEKLQNTISVCPLLTLGWACWASSYLLQEQINLLWYSSSFSAELLRSDIVTGLRAWGRMADFILYWIYIWFLLILSRLLSNIRNPCRGYDICTWQKWINSLKPGVIIWELRFYHVISKHRICFF